VFVKAAKVIVATAGPFQKYSDLVVSQCVKFGTHYVDICGEVPWVRSLIDRFHDDARASGNHWRLAEGRSRRFVKALLGAAGAVICNMCGFDSIPFDLGALFAVNRLRARQNDSTLPIRSVAAHITTTGGTLPPLATGPRPLSARSSPAQVSRAGRWRRACCKRPTR
jgi:short subunit dehydrogenase-like uncharacterized protein